MHPSIRLSNISYKLGQRVLFESVACNVESGESVAITGPSGAGKSTLLNIALGLLRPTTGEVAIAGRRMNASNRREAAQIRSMNIGMIFQFGELIPELTPVENVALPALLSGVEAKTATYKAHSLIERFGIAHTSAATDELSGGERQRLAIARALINDPPIVLADEPTGSLDAASKNDVASILFDLPRGIGTALVVVTHDITIASRADRALVLQPTGLQQLILQP